MKPTCTFSVPFGDETISFRLPDGLRGSTAVSRRLPTLQDPVATARNAVAAPVGTRRLRDLARGKHQICIAVTDSTRACPDALLVPPMLDELSSAGIPDSAITILVATGAHRASTPDEKREKLGPVIVARYRVVDHDAGDAANLVRVADGPAGVPFLLNRQIVEADLVLATGVVEPHQYAGYSGGGKTVAIGCADEGVIAYTHGPAMLDQPGTRLAQLDGNPFQAAVRAVARAAHVAFVGNAVLSDSGEVIAIAYGAPEPVQDQLARVAEDLYTVPIPSQVDIAVAGVGHPKDANLYQASRAATYLQFAPIPVVRRGGVVILPAVCPEGAGVGAGEQRFLAAMQTPGGHAALIAAARANGIRAGEQRAYIVARMLEEVTVIVAGIKDPDVAGRIGFLSAVDVEEALAMALSHVRSPASVLVVPHALLTLPRVSERATARP